VSAVVERATGFDVEGTPVSAVATVPAPGGRIAGTSPATSVAGPWCTVVVAPGAGAGHDHPFLAGFTRALAGLGVASLRFDFVYRALGKKLPDRPPRAIAAWRAAVGAAADLSDGPLWACGKSFGGRMASVAVADGMQAAGLAYLGYPLHPPGKPEKLRDEHLYGIARPQLFLQGTKDPFAVPNDQLAGIVAKLTAARLEWVEGARHSFEVAGKKQTPEQIGAGLASSVAAFIRERS
jgi:predicted alpha/beta-hydrolase family hydrolase